MKSHIHLLNIDQFFGTYKLAMLSFISAFIFTLIAIPPIISIIKRYRLYDVPNARKEHSAPIPTMGGVAIMAGMMVALFMWFPFKENMAQLSFFFCVATLFAVGIMDDLKDLSAKYKFIIQTALAFLIATSGIRITTFDGSFG